MSAYSIILSIIRHIQAYSGIFGTLCNPLIFTNLPYSEPWHRTEGLFKTLLNADQAYLGILNHIQTYSEPCTTLHIQNPLKDLRWNFFAKIVKNFN